MGKSSKTKIILAAAAVLLVVGYFGWLAPLENFFLWLTKPVFTSARNLTISLSEATSNLFTIKDLQRENADLKQRLIALETENSQLKLSGGENEELEKALNLKSRTGFNLVGGRVVSSDPTSLNQSLIIDRGDVAGVVGGQAAVDSSGAFIGRITRVLHNTAEVTLISDFSSRLPAEIAETGARGVVSGEHGLAVALVEVPQGQNLQIGGRVVTTGFTVGVPAGLFIGYVAEMRSSGSDLFQEALISPAANFKNLRL